MLLPRARINNTELSLASKLKQIYKRYVEDVIEKLKPQVVEEAIRPIAIDPLGDRYRTTIYAAIYNSKKIGAEIAAKYISKQIKRPIQARFFDTRITSILKDRTILIVDKHIVPNMENRFKSIINQGMAEGATAKQVIDRLTMLKGNYNTIARTEINSAANEASHLTAINELSAIGGVGKFVKGWQTAEDEKVRDSHQAAGRNYGAGHEIPLDDEFVLESDSVMFPAEYGKAPEEVINCRCNEYIVPIL